MRLCSAKEGGMAVSAVWRLFSLLAPDIGTKEHSKAHRWDALIAGVSPEWR